MTSEIFEAAKHYYKEGFNIIAMSLSITADGSIEKRPLTNWGAWVNRRQTEEEFEGQPWNSADSFAIICSWPNKDGLYLAVVDYDVKNVSEGAKRRGRRLLEQFPITRIERTISNGLHYVYLSRVKPQPISEAHDSTGLELIAGPKLCIMAPSKGYRALNDNPPRLVEDAEEMFREIVKLPNPRLQRLNGKVAKEKLETWLNQIKERIDVAGEGANYIYAHCPFHPPDNHPSFAIHKMKYYAVDFHTNDVYSLRELAERLNIKLEGDLREGEEKRVNLRELAEQILREVPIKTDRRTKLMYRWNGKYWSDDAEAFIQERLVEAEGENYKPYHLTALTEIIQGLTFADGFEEPPPHLINFQNGVLDITTLELRPHTPELFFRNMIHAEYNPEARAEKFLVWLKEILPEEDTRLLVQEIMGYCLYRGYPIHKIFFFVGSGRNGKGTLIRTLINLLGKENCANIPLERLGERFQVTNLIGKLVNVVSEPKTSLLITEMVKLLTGEDLISAEIKGKQKFINFMNYAKIIVLANRLPPVHDSTLAWWSRVVVVEFPVSIPPEKQVPNIEETWLNDPEERSGIINWALEGLKWLLENKKFTETETLRQKIEDYQRWSQPVQYFINKYCIIDARLSIPKTNLYETYKEVCDIEGLPIVTEEAFNREIKRIPRVHAIRKRVAGKRVYCWFGLGLKEGAFKALEDLEENELSQVVQVSQGFPYPGKSEDKIKNNEEKNEDEKFLTSMKMLGTLGTVGTAGEKWIDVNRCGDCRFYNNVKCLLRLDWVAVMPTHPACERFEKKGE